MTTPNHLQMSEAELQKSVTQLLDLYHWKWHHEVDSRKSKGGFPDLIAVHPSGFLLLIELKGHDARGRLGKVTPAQQEWLDSWHLAGGKISDDRIAACVWTPEAWHNGSIAAVLSAPRRRGANDIYARKMSR